MANPMGPVLGIGNEVKPYLLYTLTREKADKFPKGDAMRRVLQRAVAIPEVIVIVDDQAETTFEAIDHYILDLDTPKAVDVTQLPDETLKAYVARVDKAVIGNKKPQLHMVTNTEVDMQAVGRALSHLEHEKNISPATRKGLLMGIMKAVSEAAAKHKPATENRQGDFYVLVRDGSIAEAHFQDNN